jgi:ATP-binding cassette subfamily F protein 3
LSKVESAINKLEREIKEIDIELQINYEKTIARDNFFDNYHQKKQDLEVLMEEWEKISEQLGV